MVGKGKVRQVHACDELAHEKASGEVAAAGRVATHRDYRVFFGLLQDGHFPLCCSMRCVHICQGCLQAVTGALQSADLSMRCLQCARACSGVQASRQRPTCSLVRSLLHKMSLPKAN